MATSKNRSERVAGGESYLFRHPQGREEDVGEEDLRCRSGFAFNGRG